MTKRDDARLALATTAAAAFGLAGVVIHDLVSPRLFGQAPVGMYAAIGLLIAIAGLGPWLAWTRRGRTMRATCTPGRLQLGRLQIAVAEVTALHIARAARGHSVAIARGKQIVFLEVERQEEALRVAAALGVETPPFGTLSVVPASRVLALLQGLVMAVALAFGPLYFEAAVHGYEPAFGLSGKGLFGMGGVLASWIALAVLLTRRIVPGHAIALGNGTWDAHVALHSRDGTAGAIESPPSNVHLARGDEPVGTWLTRLDALPTVRHAYRGDAMKQDILWDTLGDDEAPVDARMAAARVLHRRYGELDSALVRVVGDREVRVRVEAALEDHDEAEEHIERLGPLFRAKVR